MLSPDELTHTTEALARTTDELVHTTEALESFPRILDHRSVLSERRQNILQQKQTDVLPPLTFDTPNARVAWRQVILSREENRRLRSELETQQTKLQQALDNYQVLKTEFDTEVVIIHNGHQQEIGHYQTHLQEMLAESERLRDIYGALEHRYQELYSTFQDAAEEEAFKLMAEAAQTVILTPEKTPLLVQDMVKTLELQVRQEGDKHLVNVLYLKREAQRLIEQLEKERLQIVNERQQLFALQYSIREQAELRQKTLRARLQNRWRVVSIVTSLGLLGVFTVLQFIFLALLHVPFLAPVSLAIITPLFLCTILAIVLAKPLNMLNFMYKSAPHKRGKM